MASRGAWSPLKHSLFRAMWIASVVSNIGTLWGEVARRVGVRASLNIAAAGLAAGWKMKLSAGSAPARVEPVAAE